MSCWDESVADWRQVEPPLTGEARDRDEARVRAATCPTTRTLVCSAFGGREHAVLMEIAEGAHRASVECIVTEERRRPGVRLTFTITGPTAKVDAFIAYLENTRKAMWQVPGGPGP